MKRIYAPVAVIVRKLYRFAELSGSRVANRQESIITGDPSQRWLRVAVLIPVNGHGPGVGIATQFDWGL